MSGCQAGGSDVRKAARKLGSSVLAVLVATLSMGTARPTPPSGVRDPERDRLLTMGHRLNYVGTPDAADAIWQQLGALDPGDPAAAVGEVDTIYWRLMYDESELGYDARIRERTGEAVRLADQRLEANPEDADTHYQLGRALMQRARLEGTRGHFMTAGRDGERGREHLERALVLRPDWSDPKYPLGLYYYFASLLPSLVRWASFLWFVPVGDRDTGLRYLAEVAGTAGLHRDDARLLLMIIRSYHEPQDPGAALAFARDLHARYTDNPLLHFELVEVLFATGRWSEAEECARALEQTSARSIGATGRARMARVWRARALLQTRRPHEAWALVEPMREDDPALPAWGVHWMRITRGHIHDVLGQREPARVQYELVLEYAPPEYDRSRALAEAGLARRFDPVDLEPGPVLTHGAAQ